MVVSNKGGNNEGKEERKEEGREGRKKERKKRNCPNSFIRSYTIAIQSHIFSKPINGLAPIFIHLIVTKQ